MNIIVIDMDDHFLYQSQQILSEVYTNSHIAIFTHPMLAIKYAANHPVDLVFTQIFMNMADGFDVAKLMKQLHPNAKIYFMENIIEGSQNPMGNNYNFKYLPRPLTYEDLFSECFEETR